MNELPRGVLFLIGSFTDPVTYGRLAYAADLRLLQGVWRSPAVEHFTEEITDSNDTRMWFLNGKLHREGDEPAVIHADGTQEWWVHGKRHRERDEPAVICPSGTQEWYLNGKRHREGELLEAVPEADRTVQQKAILQALREKKKAL